MSTGNRLTELRMLKLEEETIRKIIQEMTHQRNCLKIEELHLKSLQRERDIHAANSTNPVPSFDDVAKEEVNQTYLDLTLPQTFSGYAEASEEEYDEEECILNL